MTIVIVMVYAIWVILLYKSNFNFVKIVNGIFLLISLISIVLLLEDDYIGIMVMLPL